MDDSKTGTKRKLERVIRIDEGEIRRHLDGMVRETVEETLNALLDSEAECEVV